MHWPGTCSTNSVRELEAFDTSVVSGNSNQDPEGYFAWSGREKDTFSEFWILVHVCDLGLFYTLPRWDSAVASVVWWSVHLIYIQFKKVIDDNKPLPKPMFTSH